MKRFALIAGGLLAIPFSALFAVTPEYELALVKTPVVVDGMLDEKEWGAITPIDKALHFPWEKKTAPSTVFKAFHDEKNMYFSFLVKDADVVAEADWKNESTVDNEDRVELFFAPGPIDKKMGNSVPVYYAVEVDPMGRTHDYSMTFYRKNMKSGWDMPGLKTAAKIVKGGYSVEASIPLESLKKLKLIKGGAMQTGVYRAEFSKPKKGGLVMQWISWVDPKTPEPDFHVNSSFGVFKFKNLK